jgi:hypothetical protein
MATLQLRLGRDALKRNGGGAKWSQIERVVGGRAPSCFCSVQFEDSTVERESKNEMK